MIVNDEPTYICTQCLDEPNGWQLCGCPGRGDYRDDDYEVHRAIRHVACARLTDHRPHPYVERCPCVNHNPVIAQHRERMERFRAKKSSRREE